MRKNHKENDVLDKLLMYGMAAAIIYCFAAWGKAAFNYISLKEIEIYRQEILIKQYEEYIDREQAND